MKKGREYDLQDRVVDYAVWMVESKALLAPLLQETYELIAILFMSVETAKKSNELQSLDIGYSLLAVGY